jgi:energy-coupling factor transport system permease protein
MLGLLLLLFILQCIFNRSGSAMVKVGDIVILTHDAVITAGVVVLRLLVVLLSAVIVLTGQSRDYLLALNQWHVPYEISFMVMAAMRFVPILRQEASDVLCAVQMRGTRLNGLGLGNKIKVYSSIMLPVLSGTIRRCEQMSVAMEARAFRAMPGRTSMRCLRMKPVDWAWAVVFEALMCPVLVLVILCR